MPPHKSLTRKRRWLAQIGWQLRIVDLRADTIAVVLEGAAAVDERRETKRVATRTGRDVPGDVPCRISERRIADSMEIHTRGIDARHVVVHTAYTSNPKRPGY